MDEAIQSLDFHKIKLSEKDVLQNVSLRECLLGRVIAVLWSVGGYGGSKGFEALKRLSNLLKLTIKLNSRPNV